MLRNKRTSSPVKKVIDRPRNDPRRVGAAMPIVDDLKIMSKMMLRERRPLRQRGKWTKCGQVGLGHITNLKTTLEGPDVLHWNSTLELRTPRSDAVRREKP